MYGCHPIPPFTPPLILAFPISSVDIHKPYFIAKELRVQALHRPC